MNPYRLPDPELESLLYADAPCGDATTHALGLSGQAGQMVFRARGPMCLCGSEEAARMGELRGLRLVGELRASGSRLQAGEPILTLAGEAGALHRVWKTAQTLMEYLSGIASVVAEMREAAARGNPATRLVCTRKHFPGTKAAAVKAVLCAGAAPHRLSLSETVLVFREHRVFLPGQTPVEMVQRLRAAWPERPVAVEVDGEAEALQWIDAGADVLQLEKLTPEILARLRARVPVGTHPLLAVAGGVTQENAEAWARAGADILVSSAPYFAKPRDVAVSLLPAA